VKSIELHIRECKQKNYSATWTISTEHEITNRLVKSVWGWFKGFNTAKDRHFIPVGDRHCKILHLIAYFDKEHNSPPTGREQDFEGSNFKWLRIKLFQGKVGLKRLRWIFNDFIPVKRSWVYSPEERCNSFYRDSLLLVITFTVCLSGISLRRGKSSIFFSQWYSWWHACREHHYEERTAILCITIIVIYEPTAKDRSILIWEVQTNLINHKSFPILHVILLL
jgi:hypothetical protein